MTTTDTNIVSNLDNFLFHRKQTDSKLPQDIEQYPYDLIMLIYTHISTMFDWLIYSKL